jgi:hypothetical protein
MDASLFTPTAQTVVSIVMAPTHSGFRDLLTGMLEASWQNDFTTPRVFFLGLDSRSPTGEVSQWIARIASRHGVIAPVFDLAVDHPVLEPRCTHRFGVTDLPLTPDVAGNDLPHPIGLWTRVAPRARRLLMRISPILETDIVVNAETASPLFALQVGRFEDLRFAIVTTDLIAADVVGRALRAVAVPEDWDGVTPWQHPIVQTAIERRLGVQSSDETTIEILGGGDAFEQSPRFQEVIRAAAGLLDIGRVVSVPEQAQA